MANNTHAHIIINMSKNSVNILTTTSARVLVPDEYTTIKTPCCRRSNQIISSSSTTIGTTTTNNVDADILLFKFKDSKEVKKILVPENTQNRKTRCYDSMMSTFSLKQKDKI